MIKVYKKNDSFLDLKIKNYENKDFNLVLAEIIKKKINNFSSNSKRKILRKVLNDLTLQYKKENKFELKKNVKKEIEGLSNEEICEYLIHRYRYELFPPNHILDNYPPYLQIETTSVCNYRCIFCYQTDNIFNKKSNGFMGHMSFNTFKNIIDQAEKNIQFISIASRGEPLMCPDIIPMLKYTQGKFLNLKLNTNASLLDEKKSYAILESGVRTLVFSADASDSKSYSEFRVNGKFDNILKNIKKFNEIKNNFFSESKIITRVSGVKVSNKQNIDDMNNFWGELVDQVAFVDYVPWENVYESNKTNIEIPCSDLWRRMFVWWDGKINPCDVDYKSELEIGNINKIKIADAWNSENYNKIRSSHLEKMRNSVSPCNRCSVI